MRLFQVIIPVLMLGLAGAAGAAVPEAQAASVLQRNAPPPPSHIQPVYPRPGAAASKTFNSAGRATITRSQNSYNPRKQGTPAFNLQYLQLQTSMQAGSKSNALIKNVMKTKSAVGKATIGNIR
jgi:hypothetical protein